MATGKGGYDCDFVTPPKSLECPVCLLTLRDPHVISCCGNEFCQVCIERVQSDGKPCPLCSEPKFTTFLHKKLVREINALVVRCPQKELGCDWEGELGQLEQHLNPPSPDSGCGYVMVECVNQCGAHVQRQMLQEHEMETCPKRPIEMQMAGLLNKFETIVAENAVLRQEIVTIKESHKREIDEIRCAHNDDLVKLTREMAEIKTTMQKALEEKYVKLQSHTMPLPLPPLYFTMVNVDHYQRNKCSYFSKPFYSHPGGYKMYLKISFQPDFFGEYMSLHVYILSGEFDEQLQWPFDGEVTMQLYNRTKQDWSLGHSIVLNEKECGLDVVSKPVDQLASFGWGWSSNLPCSVLKRDFQHEANAIRFRVTDVKVNNSKDRF